VTLEMLEYPLLQNMPHIKKGEEPQGPPPLWKKGVRT
jgi:hypothetical protein